MTTRRQRKMTEAERKYNLELTNLEYEKVTMGSQKWNQGHIHEAYMILKDTDVLKINSKLGLFMATDLERKGDLESAMEVVAKAVEWHQEFQPGTPGHLSLIKRATELAELANKAEVDEEDKDGGDDCGLEGVSGKVVQTVAKGHVMVARETRAKDENVKALYPEGEVKDFEGKRELKEITSVEVIDKKPFYHYQTRPQQGRRPAVENATLKIHYNQLFRSLIIIKSY